MGGNDDLNFALCAGLTTTASVSAVFGSNHSLKRTLESEKKAEGGQKGR